jgi:molybdate transport system substrate-binding protein
MPQQLHVLCSMATRQILADLGGDYERAGGPRVAVESVGGVEAAKRVQAGESFDLVALAANALEPLETAGRIVAGSRVDIARSGMAMAVRAGAPRPQINNEAAVKDAVMKARTVGYSTGPSGGHLKRIFERWGIADAIAPRLVQSPPGVPVGELVARGDAEIGFQQLSELMHVSGIDIVGALPPEAAPPIDITGFISTNTKNAQAARQLLDFLKSPAATPAYESAKIFPVR